METYILVTLLAVLGAVSTQPLAPPKTPAPLILNQATDVNPDGSFKYSYETENGIQVSASGNHNAARDIQGTYSYTSPEGTPIVTTYIADGTGFKPQGDHLPKAPEVPAALTRAWAYHAAKARAKASKEASSSIETDLVPPPLVSQEEARKNIPDKTFNVVTDAPEVPVHLAKAWANYAERVKTDGSARPFQDGEPSEDLVPPTELQNQDVPSHLLMAWKDYVANADSAPSEGQPREPHSDLVPPPAVGLDVVVDEKGVGEDVPQSVPAHFARAWAAFASGARFEEPEPASSQVMLSEPFRDLMPPPEEV